MASVTEKRKKAKRELDIIAPACEDDPHPDVHGVLLSDEIIFYADTCRLLRPFDRESLKPAAYELAISDEYFQSGEFLKHADQSTGLITIPPFDGVVLKTVEVLCLPRFMIARWNIRVKHEMRVGVTERHLRACTHKPTAKC
jgi:hypothetical protein